MKERPSSEQPKSRHTDTNPAYWAEYTNLQWVKHELIREYLNGWFPKLGSWAGKIVYLDTHAGRGTHLSGAQGSPLIAVDTFMCHSSRDRILERCEVVFVFIEIDRENTQHLRAELAQLRDVPKRVSFHANDADCFTALESLIRHFDEPGRRMAPAFIFVDPYGFKVPGSILRRLMKFPRVELFINLMWRELDMAMRQGQAMASLLDAIFDGENWRAAASLECVEDRAEQTVNLLRDMTKARWATHIRMLGSNNVTRYLLLHLTNHDAGRDLMKDCIWKVCPDGGFYARKSEDPNQEYLITPEPNLEPLRDWTIERLKEGPTRWDDLLQAIRPTIWRNPHLNKVIRELRKEGVVVGDQYTGRFGPKSNPRLHLTE